MNEYGWYNKCFIQHTYELNDCLLHWFCHLDCYLLVQLGVNILLTWVFNESQSPVIDLAIWLAFLSELRSLVTHYKNNMVWNKSRTVSFKWSCMHLTFSELNGRTLTRHLWLSFLLNENPFNFFTIQFPSMNTVSLEFCDGGGKVTLSLLVALSLLLLLLSLLLLLLYLFWFSW